MVRSVRTGARLALALASLAFVPRPVHRQAAPPAPPPAEVVRAAVEAMGGETLLRDLESLRLEGFQVDRAVGVAESPTAAPLILRDFDELRDLSGGRALDRSTYRLPMRPEPIPVTRILRADSGSAEEREALQLAPERIVLRALDAPDLAARPDTTLEGRPARVVEFGADPIRLFVDAETDLPLGWSAVRRYPDARTTWAAWGDVTTRVSYFEWSLEPNGMRYPYGQVVERNGIPFRWITITRVEPDAAMAADSFPAPDSPASAAATVAEGPENAEIAPGVLFLPGAFNVAAVRQSDGVVVLEAPESGERSREVIAEIERRFPGAPLKAIVVTGRVWPHMAGLAEYAGRGVPVYAPPGAVATIRSMLAAAGAPPAELRVVESRDSIGAGSARVILRRPAIAGAPRASRALVAWMPGPEILYVGDLWVPERFEPNFWRSSRREVARVLGQAATPARTVVALHGPPLDAEAVEAGVAAIE